MVQFKFNPTKSNRITSKFGKRKHPVTGKETTHNGIDIGALQAGKDGDPLISVADGEVIINKVNTGGPTKGYGYYIVIQHDGFATLYGHLMKQAIPPVGKKVKAGEIIGYMGTTGTSTATHLHFGLTDGKYNNLKWIDPEKYLLKGNDNNMEVQEAIRIIREKTGIGDEAMQHLLNFKYNEDLVKKLAMAMIK